jgi:hypothetical protein
MSGPNSGLFTFSQPEGTMEYNYDALYQIVTRLVVNQTCLVLFKFMGVQTTFRDVSGGPSIQVSVKDPKASSYILQVGTNQALNSIGMQYTNFVAPSTSLNFSINHGVLNPANAVYKTLLDSVLLMLFNSLTIALHS